MTPPSTVTSTVTLVDRASPAQRERRRRILDAAAALATTGGFEAVQMRAVADRADVALGTLYRYFPSKTHLLVGVLRSQLERLDARLRAYGASGDTQSERVIDVLRYISRVTQSDPRLAEALTRAFMAADAAVNPEIDRVERQLTAILVRAMRPGYHDVLDPPDFTLAEVAVAEVLGDVWLSAMVAWVSGRLSTAATSARLEQAVVLLLRD